MSHAPAHDLGRCAEDCILTTPAEYRELLALRIAFAAIRAAATFAYKGPDDTDVSRLLAAAERLDGNYPAGGSNTREAVARTLRAVAAALAPVRELRGDPQ